MNVLTKITDIKMDERVTLVTRSASFPSLLDCKLTYPRFRCPSVLQLNPPAHILLKKMQTTQALYKTGR